MADTTASSAKTPWHLWLVGVLLTSWNLMGALDFTMTQMKAEAVMKALTPEQLAYLNGFPSWAVAFWGLGTWGALLGSLLLLLRRGFAVTLFGASIVGAVVTDIYSYILTDSLKVMHGGPGALVFSAFILVVAVLLLVYARAMRRRGVLR